MSTSRSSQSVVASVHPTRQQLDELDALLKRMLELPVNRVEETQQDEAAPQESPPIPMPRLVRLAAPVSPPAPPFLPAALPPSPPPEPEPTPAPLQIAPPPTEQEPPESPELEQPVEQPEQPANTRLAVQPPHLFRNLAQPGVEETAEQEPPEADDRPGDWVPLRSSWKPSPHTWAPLAESWHQAQHAAPERPHLRRDEAMGEPEPPANPQPSTKLEEPQPPAAVPVAVGFPALPAGPDTEESSQEDARPETILYPRPTYPFQESVVDRKPQTTEPKRAPVSPPEPSREETSALPWLWRPLAWVNCGFAAVVALAGPPGRWLTGPAGRTMLGVFGILCLLGALGLVVADWLGWTW